MQIITIAIGEYYLKCAVNLAASAFDKHPISLITDQELSDRERLLFQNVYEPIYVGESNLETAMLNKLSIDEYVNNEKTLFGYFFLIIEGIITYTTKNSIALLFYGAALTLFIEELIIKTKTQ